MKGTFIQSITVYDFYEAYFISHYSYFYFNELPKKSILTPFRARKWLKIHQRQEILVIKTFQFITWSYVILDVHFSTYEIR